MDKCNYENTQKPSEGIKNTCGLNLVDLYKTAKDSVVRTESPEGGVGSGFIISNGKEHLVVTVDHNLDDNSSSLSIKHKDSAYTAHAIKRDVERDIAIMKLEGKLKNPPEKDLKPSLDVPTKGAGVVALGFPGGVRRAEISPGFVRGRDEFYVDQVIVDSTQPCTFGNSGSIQLQSNGRWWGIQDAIGPGYTCISLGAKDAVVLIRQIPGWEKYGE